MQITQSAVPYKHLHQLCNHSRRVHYPAYLRVQQLAPSSGLINPSNLQPTDSNGGVLPHLGEISLESHRVFREVSPHLFAAIIGFEFHPASQPLLPLLPPLLSRIHAPAKSIPTLPLAQLPLPSFQPFYYTEILSRTPYHHLGPILLTNPPLPTVP